MCFSVSFLVIEILFKWLKEGNISLRGQFPKIIIKYASLRLTLFVKSDMHKFNSPPFYFENSKTVKTEHSKYLCSVMVF